jgi:hypothetical protein
MAASSTFWLLATTSLPIASTAASYRAQHIALKFDGELFRLYVISAQASPPRRIIRSIHLLRMSAIYHLTEREAISERILAAIAHASRPSALRERSGADSDNARAAKVIDSRREGKAIASAWQSARKSFSANARRYGTLTT